MVILKEGKKPPLNPCSRVLRARAVIFEDSRHLGPRMRNEDAKSSQGGFWGHFWQDCVASKKDVRRPRKRALYKFLLVATSKNNHSTNHGRLRNTHFSTLNARLDSVILNLISAPYWFSFTLRKWRIFRLQVCRRFCYFTASSAFFLWELLVSKKRPGTNIKDAKTRTWG